MMGGTYGTWGMCTFMLLFWLVFLVLVVWLAHTLADGRQDHRDDPLDVLKRRYAAGEISQAEFEQARRVLAPAAPRTG